MNAVVSTPSALSAKVPDVRLTSGTNTTATSASGVDTNQFMMILLAQLRNQNPLDPMNNSEFMSQMTQLNSLEQLQEINTSLQTLIDLYKQGNNPKTGDDSKTGDDPKTSETKARNVPEAT